LNPDQASYALHLKHELEGWQGHSTNALTLFVEDNKCSTGVVIKDSVEFPVQSMVLRKVYD